MKRTKILAVAGMAAVLSAACGSATHGTRDAPINVQLQDNQAPYIVNMPDEFHNMALKCVGDVLLISHTRGQSPPLAVAGASICAEGATNGIPRVRP